MTCSGNKAAAPQKMSDLVRRDWLCRSCTGLLCELCASCSSCPCRTPSWSSGRSPVQAKILIKYGTAKSNKHSSGSSYNYKPQMVSDDLPSCPILLGIPNGAAECWKHLGGLEGLLPIIVCPHLRSSPTLISQNNPTHSQLSVHHYTETHEETAFHYLNLLNICSGAVVHCLHHGHCVLSCTC